jgi:hypothetical protein
VTHPDPEEDQRPPFLRELKPLRPRREQGPAPAHRVEATGYAARAFEEEVQRLADATEGHRNDTLNVSAFNLGQLVGAHLLDYGQVWSALHAMALHVGLEPGETINTLRSGLHRGMEEPRQVPELVREQVPEVTVYSEGIAQGDTPQGPEEGPTLLERFQALDWHALWADDTVEEWLVEPLLPARRLVALFSAPKVGKSLFMLDLAVAVARGVSFLGHLPDRARVVLYVDFENDPRGDVRTRLQAMGVGPDDLGNLRYLSFPQLAKLDTLMGGLELVAIAQAHGAEVVVIDTISRAVQGEENDNDTWLSFYRNTGVHLKAAGIACIRLDHTGKDEAKGMRGGSAKYGDVDAVWAMTKLDDATLRLECTANRLPINEKRLLIDRQVHPVLRHTLNLQGVRAAIAAKVPGIVAVLDAHQHPITTGVNATYDWLRENGLYDPNAMNREAVRDAVRFRAARGAEDQQITGTDPRIKDD